MFGWQGLYIVHSPNPSKQKKQAAIFFIKNNSHKHIHLSSYKRGLVAPPTWPVWA
jgi:hypothetical protein